MDEGFTNYGRISTPIDSWLGRARDKNHSIDWFPVGTMCLTSVDLEKKYRKIRVMSSRLKDTRQTRWCYNVGRTAFSPFPIIQLLSHCLAA